MNRAQKTRVNREITVTPVRVTRDGQCLGVMPLSDALALAAREKLDLVEIAPHLSPPVCWLGDFNRFRYEQNKRRKGLKRPGGQKKVLLRFSVAPRDAARRIAQIRAWLGKGSRVTVAMHTEGRGPEEERRARALAVLERVCGSVQQIAMVEPAKGHKLVVRLTPK